MAEEKLTWKCPYCEVRVNGLTRHVSRKHKGMDSKIKLKCPFCPKILTGVRDHIRYHHLKLLNYSCGHCKKAFPNNAKDEGAAVDQNAPQDEIIDLQKLLIYR
jgi:hypothetical protein